MLGLIVGDWANNTRTALDSLRGELGMSQEQLAHAAELDRTYVSGIERGERNPSLANILRIADALDTQVAELARRAGV